MTKNIVLCCDGTGNEYGDHNTNVVGAFEKIFRDHDQIAYYEPGVGTFNFLGETVGKKAGSLMGKAFGYGLRQNLACNRAIRSATVPIRKAIRLTRSIRAARISATDRAPLYGRAVLRPRNALG